MRPWSLLPLLAACAGQPTPGPGPDAGRSTAPGVSVGGAYSTRVSLTSSTCGAVEVRDEPTTVSQVPDDAALALTHAGTRHAGTIGLDGAFTTSPRVLAAGDSTFTVSIGGRFSRTGFEAEVHVEVAQPGPPAGCAYDVHWAGTKQGPANTLP